MTRILLVPDVDNWAFAHWSRGIQKHSPPEYDVTIAVQQELQDHKEDPEWLRQFDIVHHWSWIDAPFLYGINRLTSTVAHDGLRWHHITDEKNQSVITDWRQWAASSPQRNITNAEKIIPRLDHVICVNPELEHFVRTRLTEKCSYIPAGVDTETYKPLSPPDMPEGVLRVGWCGQPEGRTKGYEWVLEPLVERLQHKFQFVINRHSQFDALTPQFMVKWYHSIDVFICTSISEGMPLPPLEAMSCGRGVISTPVGDMPQVLSGDVCGMLVPGYTNAQTAQHTIDCFAEALESLTPQRLSEMGSAARTQIESGYSWKTLAPKWLAAIAD